MRKLFSVASLIATLTTSYPVLGQSPSSEPPLEDYYSGPDFNFTHWSGVLTFTAFPNGMGRNSLRYSVCDFDPRNSLIFTWPKPGFGTGIRYPLPPGKCMVSSQDSSTYVADYDAPIIFAQNNQNKRASAYLPDLKSQSASTSRTEAPFLQDGKLSIVEFSIRVFVEKDQVFYTIEWSQGVPAVAIAFRLPEEVLRGAVEMLSKQGVKVRAAKANEIIENNDLARLGERAREANFIEISNEGRAFRGQFSHKYTNSGVTTEPIVLLDKERRVIAMSSYRSIQ
jgi:hypothetical protein